MISMIFAVVMLICGVLFLVLPEEKLVDKNKLKPDQSFEQAVKQNRRYGIIIIVVAVILFFVNVI